MTIAIDCKDCGKQVAFWLDGEETDPTATCDNCGAVYRLRVKRIAKGEVQN